VTLPVAIMKRSEINTSIGTMDASMLAYMEENGK